MTVVETRELRKEVKQYIDQADGRMLKAIRAMLETDTKNAEVSDEWLEEISEGEKAAIKKGLKQLDNGEGIPHEEAKKRLKWFPK